MNFQNCRNGISRIIQYIFCIYLFRSSRDLLFSKISINELLFVNRLFHRTQCSQHRFSSKSLLTVIISEVCPFVNKKKSNREYFIIYFCASCTELEDIQNDRYVVAEEKVFLSDQFLFLQVDTNLLDFSKN